MPETILNGEEIARKGKDLYERRIRRQVETPENVGKIVVIDVETGNYALDDLGIDASHKLHNQHPNAPLYGIRIGYNVAETLGGVMERTKE